MVLFGTGVVVGGGVAVVNGSPVGCATLVGFSDHSRCSARARNRFTLPQVRHLTTTCLSRRAVEIISSIPT